jgi:hypothetical protein
MAATAILTDHISSSAIKEQEKKLTSESQLKEKVNDTTLKSSTSSSYVFLRVKRKRHEDALEQLVIQTNSSDSKKHKSSSSQSYGELIDQFNGLSTKEQQQQQQQQQKQLPALMKPHHVIFQRIDTIDQKKTTTKGSITKEEEEKKFVQHLKKKMKLLTQQQQKQRTSNKSKSEDYTHRRMIDQQERAKEQRLEGIRKTRNNKKLLRDQAAAVVSIKEEKTIELATGIHLVDLYTTTNNNSTSRMGTNTSTRVLNPSERELDEAIWRAFRENDFSFFFRIFSSIDTSNSMLKIPAAQFQRVVDGSTILMAAAAHNRADVIEMLLRKNAANVLQKDWQGQTASCFARLAGHKNIEKALLACEEVEKEKDYVYDVYCIDIHASRQQHHQQEQQEQQGQGQGQGQLQQEQLFIRPPIVSVSSAVQRWLSEDHHFKIDATKDNDQEEIEEYMLESDLDSNEEIDGESIDSNDEAYEFNDYPDEEEDEEDNDPWNIEDSDEEDQGIQRMKAWQGTSNTKVYDDDDY